MPGNSLTQLSKHEEDEKAKESKRNADSSLESDYSQVPQDNVISYVPRPPVAMNYSGFPAVPPPPPYYLFSHGNEKANNDEQQLSVQTDTFTSTTSEASGDSATVTTPDQSAAPTLQDLNAIETEINDIEKTISDINNKIGLGEIDAITGAARVKSLMAEAKMKEKRLKRVKQIVMQQQGAMPLWQGMWQAQPGMMYAPQSPQGMPVQPMMQNPPMMGPPMSPYGPMPGQLMMQNPPMMEQQMPPQQTGSENYETDADIKKSSTTQSEVAGGMPVESEDADDDDTDTKKNDTKKQVKSSLNNEVHKQIFTIAGPDHKEEIDTKQFEELTFDKLYDEIKNCIDGNLEGNDLPKKERTIIENLLKRIKEIYESYKARVDDKEYKCLSYRSCLRDFVQKCDFAIVEAFYSIPNISEKISEEDSEKISDEVSEENCDSRKCASGIMADLINILQTNAYIDFYNEQAGKLYEKEEDYWNLTSGKGKDSGKKYDIATCYVGTARTINNLIEVIKFMLGEGQDVAKEVEVVGKLCGECINLNTPFNTSRTSFNPMLSKLHDIVAAKNKVFGSAVNNVNDQKFSDSLTLLIKLIKDLGKLKQEDQFSIEGRLVAINELFCKIPSNSADYKFNSIREIMFGILTEGDYNSHDKMFRR